MNTNTRQILIAIAVAGAMAVTVAMAQTPATPTAAPAPAATAAPAAAAPAESGHRGRKPMKFEERKAKKLQSLEKAAARIQQQQACVQAATDNDALDKCKPPRHKRRSASGADNAAPATAPAATPAPSGK